MFDGAAFGKEMVGIVKGHVTRALDPLLKRLDALEKRTEGISADAARQMVAGAVAKALSELSPAPAPEPWQPTDEHLRALLQPMVDALPKAENGKSVTVDDVAPLIAEQVAKAVGALQLPVPEEPSEEFLKSLMAPLVDALPRPMDGKSVTVDDVMPIVSKQVAEAIAALPRAKDGIGLASALIGRDGNLVVTLTDGSAKDLGPVVGEDADMAFIERRITEMVEAIPPGRDGKDGLGFDDMVAEYDGERGIVLRFVRGEQVKEFAFTMPVIIDRGVWTEGKSYTAGDAVTWAGSVWIAQKDTDGKPDGGDGWRLSVKRGRDGKDGVVRDLTPKPVKVS